jgi:hypothetical protein
MKDNSELYNFVNDLKSVIEVSKKETENLIEKFEVEILDFNKEQIFVFGEQSDGTDLTSTNSTVGVYSEFTEELNKGKSFSFKGITKQKIAGEKYFLVDENQFFSSFKVETNDKGFKIQALTKKPKVDLIAEYGDILGLNATNLEKLQIILINNLFEVLENYFMF